ncbi:hypothetical protein J3F83DRAFT_740527 [Trichoderma novae-zelandiae]
MELQLAFHVLAEGVWKRLGLVLSLFAVVFLYWGADSCDLVVLCILFHLFAEVGGTWICVS